MLITSIQDSAMRSCGAARARLGIAVTALSLLMGVQALRADSIFDFDDKNPPAPAHPTAPKPPPTRVDPIVPPLKPDPARPYPPVSPLSPALPASLKPVPATAELQRVGKLFKEATVKSDTPANTAANVRTALELVDQMVAAENFTDAARLAGMAAGAAAGDVMYSLIAQHRAREIEAMRAAYTKVAKDLETLKATPNDPAANLAVGTWHAFYKGDWARGLPLLAKGSETGMKTFVSVELDKNATAEGMLSVAEGWWTFADQQPETAKLRIRGHAAALYQANSAGLGGLRKEQVQRRIFQGTYPPGVRAVDLLAAVEPERDAIHGKWSKSDEGLTATGEGARLELPYMPSAEYLFRIEFTADANHPVLQGLAKAGTSFQWIMGAAENKWIGFEMVNKKAVDHNPTGVKLPGGMELNRRHVSLVEVRNGRVRGYFDGKLISDWRTDYTDLKPHDGDWAPRDPLRLALGASKMHAVFSHIEVLELGDGGRLIR